MTAPPNAQIAAWECARKATESYERLMTTYRQDIDNCVASAANETDGNNCSNIIDGRTNIRVRDIQMVGFRCILNASTTLNFGF